MSSRRTAILIGAIAVGIVAVLLIVSYVNGIKQSVEEEGEAVPVFFAQTDIKRGTDGSLAATDGSIASASIPRKFYPATAIQSLDAVQKKVALFDIAANTVIVTGMFVDPSTTQITFRERLSSPKHVAISISTDAIHGVGGFLVPGDEINMMIYQDNARIKTALETPEPADAGAQEENPNISGGTNIKDLITEHPGENIVGVGGPQWIVLPKTARYMWQKTKIIAVGSSVALTPGEQASTPEGGATTSTTQNANVLTLEVPPEAAQWIATGEDLKFYLSLVAKDYAPKALRPLPVVIDVLPGENPARLCPYFDTTDGEEGCTK